MYQNERNQLKGHGKEEECAQQAAPKRTKTGVTKEKTATTTIAPDENKKTRTMGAELNVSQKSSDTQREKNKHDDYNKDDRKYARKCRRQ